MFLSKNVILTCCAGILYLYELLAVEKLKKYLTVLISLLNYRQNICIFLNF